MKLTAEDIQDLLSTPIYKIRRAISPDVTRIQQEFSRLIKHAAERAKALDKSGTASRQSSEQIENNIQRRFTSSMKTLFRNLGGDANAKDGVAIDQFANSILHMGFTWATYSLDEAWVLSAKMDSDLDSRISWDDFSDYVNKILEGTEMPEEWSVADEEASESPHDEPPVFAVLRVSADQARTDGHSVLSQLDQLVVDESTGSTLSKAAAKKLLDFLRVKVSVNAWENVTEVPGRIATLQSTGDLGECLRELSWTRVLIQGQLAAFDDKYASAKQQLQEFEERRNQLDELRNSRVNDSLALSAVEAFFEQQDSPSRSPKYRAQSPTKLRRTKSSPDLRLRRPPPTTPQGFARSSLSPVSRRSSRARDDMSYASEYLTLSSRTSNVIRTPLSRRSSRRSSRGSSLSDVQDLALGQRVIQMLYT